MSYAIDLREIDKPRQPSLFLAKPDKTTIAKLKHVKDVDLIIKHNHSEDGVHELSFTLPYHIELENEIRKNPHINKVKEKHLVRFEMGDITEWFLINNIKKASSTSDDLIVQCYSLAYQLQYQLMIEYEVVGYNCLMVTQDALRRTDWKPGYINPDFNLQYREFNVSSQSKLDFLYDIAKTFDAIIRFDTINKTVNFYKEEELSQYKGFRIGYGKYIENVEDIIDADEIVTRLYVYGSDGLRINSINPTGQSYIDDFSYFLYPFEMDENENIISHSDYMSDSLAKALVKYNKYVTKRKDDFRNYQLEKTEIQEKITKESNKLHELEIERDIILDNIELAKDIGESTSKLNKERDTKNKEIADQEKVIDNLESKVDEIDQAIKQLQEDLDMDNHLTEEQRIELSNFIQESEWTDENQYDPNDLYEAGLEEMKERNTPPINIEVGLVNFFEMVSEKHNWNRFKIGDIIKIDHEKLGLDVKTTLSQARFDFENASISVTISNSKRSNSLEDEFVNSFYTINKVDTDYNKRKINWNKIAYNYNLRNDRIEKKPVKPTIESSSLTHRENDDGSANLMLTWKYPDYNKTKKDEHNIDGFLIYLYHGTTNEPYQFGSQMSKETIVDAPLNSRSYTFPAVPANLYYTVGIRAYRRVDDDINRDGIIMSDIVRFNDVLGGLDNQITTFSTFAATVNNNTNDDAELLSKPYQPTETINLKNAKINGSRFTVSDKEPSNPEENDIWINPVDSRIRVWINGKWTVDETIRKEVEKVKENIDQEIEEYERQLREKMAEVEAQLKESKELVDSEMERIENEVVPNVERAIKETYIPKQDTPPEEIPGSGLWWNTTVHPPRMMMWDEDYGDWRPLAPTDEEVDELIEEMRKNTQRENIEYTQEEIHRVRQVIVNEINRRTASVKKNIEELHKIADRLNERSDNIEDYIDNLIEQVEQDKQAIEQGIKDMQDLADDLNQMAENLRTEFGDLEGRITNISIEVDEALGEITAAVKTVEGLDERVTSNTTQLEILSGEIEAKVDELTYIEDKQGIIESIEANTAAIGVNAKEIELKASQEFVDNLENRVSNAETTLAVHAEGIEAKAEKTEVYTKTETDELLENKVEVNVYSQKIASIDATIEGIQTNVTSIIGEIDGITGNITGIKKQVADFNVKAEGIETSVQNLQSEFNEMTGEIASVKEDFAQLVIKANSIESKVTAIETDFGNKIETNSTLIRQTADGINAKIDSFEQQYDQDKTDILSSISSNESEINAMADEISLRVTREEFENLQIGGRNLLKNSGNFKSIDGWSDGVVVEKDGYKAIEVPNGGTILNTHYVALEPDTYYVYSGWLMSSVDLPSSEISETRPLHHQMRSGGSNSGARESAELLTTDYPEIIPANTWFKIEVLLKTRSNIDDDAGFYAYVYSSDTYSETFTSHKYWLRDFKLEKGTKATDWTPALEDTQSQIDSAVERIASTEAKLDVHADKINARVHQDELINYVDYSTYNNRMSELNVTLDGIVGRVSNTEANIDDLTGEVESTSSKIATLEINVSGINSSVSNLSSDLDTANKAISSVEQRVGSIESTVSSLETDVSGLEGNMSAVQTKITQLPGEIDLAVSEGIRNLDISGRNLFSPSDTAKNRSSGEITKIAPYSFYATSNWGALSERFIISERETLTVSFWVKSETEESDILRTQRIGYTTTSGTTRTSVHAYNATNVTKEWKYYEDTFTVADGTESMQFFARTDNGKIWINGLMIVRGNKAPSDWTPAPEDMVNKTNVLSSINLSTEGVRIQGSKIDIQGLVSVLNSDGSAGTLIQGNKIVSGSITSKQLNVNEIFANSAVVSEIRSGIVQTTNLSATRITSGTLDAGKITVKNLSASSIVSGTLDASKVNVQNLNASNINTGTLNSININGSTVTGSTFRGGTLVSLNNNTRFNLNTGSLTIQNADFTLGGGANIYFSDSGNKLLYNKYDSVGKITRSAGIGFGTSINDRFPFAYFGTTNKSTIAASDNYNFTGFIVNTRQRELTDDIGGSYVGRKFHIRDEATNYKKGWSWDLSDSRITMIPMNTGTYNYDIGSPTNNVQRVYAQSIRSNNGFIRFRNASSSYVRQGFTMETTYDGESHMHFRGTHSDDYWNLGKPGWRFSYIYLNYQPNVSSDERLKENIKDNSLGLDFINDIDTKTFNLINRNKHQKYPEPTQFGVIAQQLEKILIKHGVKVDNLNMLSKGEDGYWGVQYTQLIAPIIKAIQELNKKTDSEISRLRNENKMLKQRIEQLEELVD